MNIFRSNVPGRLTLRDENGQAFVTLDVVGPILEVAVPPNTRYVSFMSAADAGPPTITLTER